MGSSLKLQAIAVLNAVALVAGPVAKAAITLAIWVVNRFVPDSAAGVSFNVSAAPAQVKSILRGLFNQVLGLIPSAFARRLLSTAADTVLERYIDQAWDALTEKITPLTQAFAPEPEAEAALAAACEAA